MLNSVLLHLEHASQAQPVIRLGVSVARQTSAKVRGLTLLDTRGVEAACQCESAGYVALEHTRQSLAERQQNSVRAELSRACLDAGLNFDVRRMSGDPLQVLPQEARFHDLVVTSVSTNGSGVPVGDWSLRDLASLLQRGVQPLLVVQSNQQTIGRVLMVYDGSEAAGRAIRLFLGLGIFSDAEHRLLAVSRDEVAARHALREMGDYCQSRRLELETGIVCGSLRKVLLPYAQRWQADLIVLGVERGNRLLRWLLGDPALEAMKKLSCSLFAAS